MSPEQAEAMARFMVEAPQLAAMVFVWWATMRQHRQDMDLLDARLDAIERALVVRGLRVMEQRDAQG